MSLVGCLFLLGEPIDGVSTLRFVSVFSEFSVGLLPTNSFCLKEGSLETGSLFVSDAPMVLAG